MNRENIDVIVVGGSYSGLSAAMALGRSLRNVLIIDSGLPCNRQTPHSHNFITHDGEKPAIIAEKAKVQVLGYPSVEFHNGLAISGKKVEKGFSLTTEAGKTFTAKKLLFATGIKDLMPDIKGFSACWGISVVHCPYCHGYEIRKRKTGIMANGDRAYHIGSLVNNLTDDITLLTTGKANFSDDQLATFSKHGIKIIEKEMAEIVHENGLISQVTFMDGSMESFEAVYAALPFEQHSHIPADLGCEINDQGFIQVDMMQKTTISGVYASGDNCSGLRSVANAIAAGNMAGAAINMELTQEQF